MSHKQILGIVGSTKKQSSNKKILEFIKTEFAEKLEVDIFDQLEELPHFNPDLDNNKPPQEIINLRKRIESSDGVILCTPEYVFNLPGSLKNLIEWMVSTTVFSGKPVGLIVAAASGEKAMESLDLIMTTIEAKMNDETKLLIKGIKGKMSSNGTINNAKTRDEIKHLMKELIKIL